MLEVTITEAVQVIFHEIIFTSIDPSMRQLLPVRIETVMPRLFKAAARYVVWDHLSYQRPSKDQDLSVRRERGAPSSDHPMWLRGKTDAPISAEKAHSCRFG
jgi:hypothetical protein